MDADDIRLMPKTDAIRIYRERFWKRPYKDIMSQAVATKLIDTCVNVGTAQDHRLFQRAIVACGERIVIDGAVVPRRSQRRTAIRRSSRSSLCAPSKPAFYTNLVQRKPTLAKSQRGWLRRAAR